MKSEGFKSGSVHQMLIFRFHRLSSLLGVDVKATDLFESKSLSRDLKLINFEHSVCQLAVLSACTALGQVISKDDVNKFMSEFCRFF